MENWKAKALKAAEMAFSKMSPCEMDVEGVDGFTDRMIDTLEVVEKEEYVNLLEKALLEILDGTSAGEIQALTGIKFERCVEFVSLIPIIEEHRKVS